MESKTNKLTKVVNITILESYPSVLKHSIPIIQIFAFLIYVPTLIYYNIVKLIEDVKKMDKTSYKKIFKREKKRVVLGPVEGEVSYDIETETFSDKKISKIEAIKVQEDIKKTEIIYYYGKKAVTRLAEIVNENNLISKIDHLPSEKGFILKEETLFIDFKGAETGTVFFLTKSYTIAALRTMYILDKIRSKLTFWRRK